MSYYITIIALNTEIYCLGQKMHRFMYTSMNFTNVIILLCKMTSWNILSEGFRKRIIICWKDFCFGLGWHKCCMDPNYQRISKFSVIYLYSIYYKLFGTSSLCYLHFSNVLDKVIYILDWQMIYLPLSTEPLVVPWTFFLLGFSQM